MAIEGTDRQRDHAAVALPLLCTLALCLLDLGSRQAWRDEQMTWWVTTLPHDGFLLLLSTVDAVMAPYYVLQRGLVALVGDDIVVMRAPSALAMGLAGGLVSAFVIRLLRLAGNVRERDGSRGVGLTAGLCFALIPSVSYYGQEARVYACAVAAVLGSGVLLLSALQLPSRTRRWIAYGSSLMAIALSHLVGLTVLVAHAVLVLLWSRQQEAGARTTLRVRWVVSVATCLLLLVPFLWLCAGQGGQVSWNRPRWRDLGNLPDTLFHAPLVGWLLIGAALVACWRLRSEHSLARLTLAIWAFAPTVFLFATRKLLHLFLHRYLLFTLPAVSALAALLAFDLTTRTKLRVLPTWSLPAALLCLVASLGYSAQLRNRQAVSWNRADYRHAVQFVLREQRPGDAIAFGADPRISLSRLGFVYFARDAQVLPRDLFTAVDPTHPERFCAEGCPDTRQCLTDAVSRLWLLTTSAPEALWANLPGDRAEVLQRELQVAEVHRFKDLSVALLVRDAGEAH